MYLQAFKQYLGAKSGQTITADKDGRFGTQLRGRGTDSAQSSTRRKRSISITKGITSKKIDIEFFLIKSFLRNKTRNLLIIQQDKIFSVKLE